MKQISMGLFVWPVTLLLVHHHHSPAAAGSRKCRFTCVKPSCNTFFLRPIEFNLPIVETIGIMLRCDDTVHRVNVVRRCLGLARCVGAFCGLLGVTPAGNMTV